MEGGRGGRCRRRRGTGGPRGYRLRRGELPGRRAGRNSSSSRRGAGCGRLLQPWLLQLFPPSYRTLPLSPPSSRRGTLVREGTGALIYPRQPPAERAKNPGGFDTCPTWGSLSRWLLSPPPELRRTQRGIWAHCPR